MSVGRSPAPTSASPDKEGSFAPRLAGRSGLPGWFSGISLGSVLRTNCKGADYSRDAVPSLDGCHWDVEAGSFLPRRGNNTLAVVGIELLPIGLLVIAVDIPFLQKPVARAVLWLERKWIYLRRRQVSAKDAKPFTRWPRVARFRAGYAAELPLGTASQKIKNAP
jgi:hypothetical protein